MRQAELNRAVARATGESLATIQRLGFLLADPIAELDADFEDDGPYVIDWDELEAERSLACSGRPIHEPTVL